MKAKAFSALGGVMVIVLLAVAALGARNPAPAQGPSPDRPAPETETAAVEATGPVQKALDDAARLMEQGRFKEAAMYVEWALTKDPANTKAWTTYFELVFKRAEQHQEEEEPGEAVGDLEKALKAVRGWRNVLVRIEGTDPEAIAKLVLAQEAIQDKLDSLAKAVRAKAESLYSEGKGEHWYNNDNEDKFIDALVLLDSQKVDLLSPRLREAHAAIWTKCSCELGKNRIEEYKKRTAIENGRGPNAAL